MPLGDPTYIGQIASVTGAIIRVRLREDMPSTLVMIGGESYRVGQIGGFFRVPLGYTNLYAVCTQIGADAAPPGSAEKAFGAALEDDMQLHLSGYRWMTIVLFGEALGGEFERGVGQYPTVGDEVHLVTNDDLKVIYGWAKGKKGTISVGRIAAVSGISADISVAGLVSRHSAIVGSTGAGKSNLVTVLLETVSDGSLPNARAIVIDPHGEYATALGDRARVFRIRPNEAAGEKALWVPFWALPFVELQQLTLGGLQPNHEATIRDEVLDMKVAAAAHLAVPPPPETLTADTPVPFSIKKLWYELDKFERMTFPVSANQTDANVHPPEQVGDAMLLRSDRYPAASPYNQAPYKNQKKRNLERQLDLMRSRLKDARFSFLFSPGGGYEPDLNGEVANDLNTLVRDWVGHDKPITIFDVSGLPSEVLPTIVGTMLRIVYDMLFWAQDLPIGGRLQPLLVVLDEAHRFVPEGVDTPAHRTLSMIAKEGRKYGTGLMLVTQRPSEIDSAILSQCGSMIALRLTNSADRAKVSAAVPDDLGGLVDQLPSLRTGEGVFLGEVMPIPSRVRVRKAKQKPVGDDPKLPDVWQVPDRPNGDLYTQALANWRAQSTSVEVENDQDEDGEGQANA
ncbi:MULTISPECIES: ATP-binding protein [unclassified Bradyrhizobium]|uniref:ATP-binding protein n=1 Tax=unclassified Bradyrhizobium TaxID=2631580 RepID=UPI001FF7250E|nr:MULTISPECIES: ATP-binding protein [unclassified Bradyrhizobium]MCK1296768.1 ATP-binding protein [Bradyrhizobium sp. 37]MCK1769004.1 ATP-binding protein [Bradyrhizobium sp. 134]